MKIFGYDIRRSGDYLILEKKLSLQESINAELAHQNSVLKRKVDGNKLVGVIDVDIGDPTPDKIALRREYIGRVSSFYKDIMQSKLLQMISVFHKLLEEETNDRETDLYLKIGVFICRDFLKWGNDAVNENLSYATEPPPTTLEQKDALIN